MIAKLVTVFGLICCCLGGAQSVLLGNSKTALQVETVLTTYPESCVNHGYQMLQAQQINALQAFSTCSVSAISADLKVVGEATVKMVAAVALDVSGIVFEIQKCIGKINPISIAICVVEDIIKMPTQIKDIITEVTTYIKDTKEEWPALFNEIKKCFKKSSDDYETYMLQFISQARQCRAANY